MSHLSIYLLMMLDNINSFLTIIFVCLLISSPIVLISWFFVRSPYSTEDEDKELNAKYCKITRHILISAFLLLLLSVFIPTTNQAITIYITPKIASIKNIDQIPPLLVNYIEKQLKENTHE